MKHLFVLWLVIVGVHSYAQNTIIIDSSFSDKDLYNTMHYYYDINSNETVSSILHKEFLLFNTSFPGKKNTKFWFKFKVNNTFNTSKELVLKYGTSTVSNLKLYKVFQGNLIKQNEFKNSLKRKVDFPITLAPKETTEYYMEVSFARSVYFPVKLTTVEKSNSIDNTVLISDTLFYGFALVVLIINLLFFVNTKNSFFIYYCWLLTGIILSMMSVQGLFYNFIDSTIPVHKSYIILVLNFITITGFIGFTSNALTLYKNYPKHKIIGASLLGLFIIGAALFFITNVFIWYSIAKVCYFILGIFYWFYGVLLFKKMVYARFLTVGYAILVFSQVAYMISVNFGYTEIGFTHQYYKIGCFVEMLVFLYAISYRHKDVEEKRIALQTTYAKSVKSIKQLKEEAKHQQEKSTINLEDKVSFFKEKFDLNLREIQVLKGHLQGLKNKEIGQELALSEASIKHYNKRLFEKTNTKNKVQLINAFNSIKKE